LCGIYSAPSHYALLHREAVDITRQSLVFNTGLVPVPRALGIGNYIKPNPRLRECGESDVTDDTSMTLRQVGVTLFCSSTTDYSRHRLRCRRWVSGSLISNIPALARHSTRQDSHVNLAE